MLRFYLIFNIFIILGNFLFAQENELELENIQSTDSNSVVFKKNNYPGKPLIMSLIYLVQGSITISHLCGKPYLLWV